MHDELTRIAYTVFVDDLPERIEALKSAAVLTHVDHLETILNTVLVCANLAETELRIGEPDAARKALQRAEAELAKARDFLSSPKHRLPDQARQELTHRADSLWTRLDGLRRSMV
jgi:hypothetical protein